MYHIYFKNVHYTVEDAHHFSTQEGILYFYNELNEVMYVFKNWDYLLIEDIEDEESDLE